MAPILFVLIVLFSVVTAQVRVLDCIAGSTGKCTAVAGCILPSDAGSCLVEIDGVQHPCTSPPTGYLYMGVICTPCIGCTTCRANGLFQPAPRCQLRMI